MKNNLRRDLTQFESPGSTYVSKTQTTKTASNAQSRIDTLFDANSFVELDKDKTHSCHNFDMQKKVIAGDGVIIGYGLIDGRKAFAYAQDRRVMGGSISKEHAEKICKIMDMAMKVGAPIIGLLDSGGARIQGGVHSLAGYGEIFKRNVRASGVVPQISCILGTCAGGAVYSPALTDFTLMVQDSSCMFVTGPKIVKEVTHEDVSQETLGGATMHHEESGIACLATQSDADCIAQAKALLAYFPNNHSESAPSLSTQDPCQRSTHELDRLLPQHANQAYDIREIIKVIADDHQFFELHGRFAQNIVVGFAHFSGQATAIIANQPQHLAGCLDINASVKAARFIRFCDAFNISIVSLVDVPGFLPGSHQESRGIIKHGAQLLYAYSEATVPKITLVLRKAYGGAYIVMASKHLDADINLALPSAEIAVMGAEAAAQILYKPG
ncbi:MAG TPA: acyl-CoA carboxylase subunit beta, partial [Chromatiaceae bacterium]|nr:acyl-CoA carboxylase subunit beta [Chromatiaceae bacterium]